MKLLEGKTALITGAARGIGKAIALKFAQEGANIAFTDLVIDENGKATEAEIAALESKPRVMLLMLPTSLKQRKWLAKYTKTSAVSTFWSTMPASPKTA